MSERAAHVHGTNYEASPRIRIFFGDAKTKSTLPPHPSFTFQKGTTFFLAGRSGRGGGRNFFFFAARCVCLLFSPRRLTTAARARKEVSLPAGGRRGGKRNLRPSPCTHAAKGPHPATRAECWRARLPFFKTNFLTKTAGDVRTGGVVRRGGRKEENRQFVYSR